MADKLCKKTSFDEFCLGKRYLKLKQFFFTLINTVFTIAVYNHHMIEHLEKSYYVLLFNRELNRINRDILELNFRNLIVVINRLMFKYLFDADIDNRWFTRNQ
jgi:hypothetical protein